MMWDTIVVGAGIEGSAAAYHLARRGRKTLLLEQVGLLVSFQYRPMLVRRTKSISLSSHSCISRDVK